MRSLVLSEKIRLLLGRCSWVAYHIEKGGEGKKVKVPVDRYCNSHEGVAYIVITVENIVGAVVAGTHHRVLGNGNCSHRELRNPR